MVRLYIFDMGGVVSQNTNVAPDIARYLDFNGARMAEFARDDFIALTTGAISAGEFTRRFSAKSGRTLEEDLLTRFFDPELDPEMAAIVEGLKEQARVVAGTNTITPHYELHQQKGDYDVFDAVYASHLMGLAKPDPAFYSYILDRERCLPEQAVFIDDVQANVQAAGKLGIRSFLFTGAEQLKKDLSKLGRSAT
jgi:epoxide hydrolase-like predicted phosphatase